MRILLAHNRFSVAGGAEVFFHEIGRILKAAGHEVAYFSAYEEDVDSEWRDFFPRSPFNAKRLGSRILGFPSMVHNREAARLFGELIDHFKPDVVHAFAIYVQITPSILKVAKAKGVPVVMSCNDYKLVCPSYKLFHHGRLCFDCEGGAFYNAVRNRCSHDSYSHSLASAIEAYAQRIAGTYRQGVSLHLFASQFMAEKTQEMLPYDIEWRLLRNPFNAGEIELDQVNRSGSYALYFGRLIEEKGVDLILRAARDLPDMRFVIVGDGPDRQTLEATSRELGLGNVEFRGALWGDKLEEVVNGCKFVIVPSVWHENFPYVILQAFAAGKAVIASLRGGMPELVKDGITGLTFDPSSNQGLTHAVRQLCSDNKLRIAMQRNCRELVTEQFNDERIYQDLISIYSEVVS